MKKVFLCVLFLFLIVVRFYCLDRFPVGMSHDEIEYTLSSRTYFLTGADLSGSYFPKSIFETKTEGIISFLAPLILSPYFGTVLLNQFTARLPYVVINILTAWIFYLLVKKLFNKKLALLSTVIFLINPWSFYLSRVATDTVFSLMFYLWGILWFLDVSKKKRWGSLILFILGFLSYHGAKVVFLPLIFVCVIYSYLQKTIKLKEGLLFLIIGLVITIVYFGIGAKFFNQSVNQTRSNDIWILNRDSLSETVNTERKATINNPFDKLFLNKATVILKTFSQKYLTAFSPEVLFISGDSRGTYRFGYHGLFYITDLVFILIGLMVLYKKYPRKMKLLLSLVIISPIATAVSGVETSVINRSFLLLPVLVIFSSIGVLSIYEVAVKKIGKVLSLICLVVIGLLLFLNFLFFYFFRWPITGQENYFFSQKIVANYINRIKDKKIIVVDPESREVFLEAVFYSQNKNQNLVLKDFVTNQKFVLNNASFTDKCPEVFDKNTIYIVNRTQEQCLPKNSEYLNISEEQFGGPLYYIKNDTLCSKFELQPWLRFRLVKDYAVEKLDDQNFCHNWIKKQK